MKFTGERFIPGLPGQIQPEHLNRYYFVINQIDLTGLVVLDLASGEGYGSDLLAKYSKHVYGVDISLEAIAHSKSRYNKENLDFLIGDAIKIPLPGHSIDIVVSFETIEHHDKHNEMFSEIKRVLKPNGVLVMSSPDKYFYSDLPDYNNEFHIKELYYEDFKKLINGYFNKSFFFCQKIFVGSIITLDEGNQLYRKPLVVEKDGTSNDFTPVYNVAIGTDNLDFCTIYQQILYKETDYILTDNDINFAIQSVKKSRPYKLGILISSPYRFIKKILLRK
jgi:SAM-dependent methyltransferase